MHILRFNRADSDYVEEIRTWSKTIPGKVEFFSSEGSDTSIPIPIVPLPGVDDSYPPQKKSFMMLKYMHDHYLDKYEWFMRADDDVYIKGDKLENFLRSLNSSEPLFLGQTGLGTTEEMGKLALEPGENFCMGGPGVIMSREVLRRMVPHIGECLREMYTTHEDVEVGRCVRRFAGVQCVWSYEWAQEMPPPHQLGAEKSQVEIAKIITIVCFSSQKASKSERIELEVKSPAETNLWFSISLSEPWPRALTEDDFLIKLGEAELAGGQMRLFAGTREQSG
ncbi:hypothetical protein llap_15069 [Limosa lapponica baueri]|uniref:N-acetylgalactosaminyl-proteoglycan 3-beta-glucuronosyltransferase n=1 Tax=Limosa lapponica baueri TaxID=1758121 RepID=A0A2I0TLE6_LIMLA|nr:hypothetical protein llap_15069 [Limosa lapponica baueri]